MIRLDVEHRGPVIGVDVGDLDLPRPDTGEAVYLLSPPVVGFFEFSLMRFKDSLPKKRLAEALEATEDPDGALAAAEEALRQARERVAAGEPGAGEWLTEAEERRDRLAGG